MGGVLTTTWKTMIASAKKIVWMGIHAARLVTGLIRYAVRGKTSASAHLGMILLFCWTRGRSSDLLSRVISWRRPPYDFPPQDGILKLSRDDECRRAVSSLRERGFYIFKNRLPDDLCDRLLEFALTSRCTRRAMDGEQPGAVIATIYDRKNPSAVRYDFSTQDLLDNRDIQRILSDLSFAVVAQEYLAAKPIIDIVTLWWHTSFSDKPDSEAAQYFHFDMDRSKWVKFFIHLTDVRPKNGAHFFVAGSHKSGAIPKKLLDKGYARLSDEEVIGNFPREDIMEFVAPRGTILAEDTRGLHKGKHVEQGDRLMLQIQFSNSLFGADYAKAHFNAPVDTHLQDSMESFPEIYSAYLEA